MHVALGESLCNNSKSHQSVKYLTTCFRKISYLLGQVVMKKAVISNAERAGIIQNP